MMARGTVKSFNLVKGYGFITQDQDGPDVFVHLSQVRAAGLSRLRKGQRLRFEMFDNQGRAAARHLQLEWQPEAVPIPSEPTQGINGDRQTKRDPMNRKPPSDSASDRLSVFRSVLEQSLSDAIRTDDPECSGLVGVILEPAPPGAANGANWAVKGVRFGRVDRDRCTMVLARCLANMGSKYQVSEWSK